jgi:hypothetical protein
MTYYTRIAYYDEETDVEEYGTQEEAATAYVTALDARADAGRQFGDCSRISWGRIVNGKMKPINAKTYD